MPHLAGELLKLIAKIDIVHVPYRGAAPAMNDLLGQQVQMAFLDQPILLPQIKAGGLRAIALGAPERAPTLPDVPTTAEVGMPDLLAENWHGMVAPAGTPAPIVATLNRDRDRSLADPDCEGKARHSRRHGRRRQPGTLPRVPGKRDHAVGEGDQGRRRRHREVKLLPRRLAQMIDEKLWPASAGS